jgi:hypothetical protein
MQYGQLIQWKHKKNWITNLIFSINKRSNQTIIKWIQGNLRISEKNKRLI